MFRSFGIKLGPSGRRAAAGIALAAMAAAGLALPDPASAQTQGQTQALTEQQMIDQLLGKTSRGAGQATTPAPTQATAGPESGEAARLKQLLDKAKTRAFSAKERTEIAEAVKERPSLDFEIYFGFNSSNLQNAAMETMKKIGQLLTNPVFKDRAFLIAGHTDAKGKPEANQKVSQRRAESVKAFLVKMYNIDPNRLRVIGYGKEQLKDPGQPFSAINRRVQIINLPDGTLTASR